jgi:predicted lipoprotein
MKKIMLPLIALVILAISCTKNEGSPAADFNQAKEAAIADFVNKIAVPAYGELLSKATTLNNAVLALNTQTSDANLSTAKNAWKDLRSTWERCEGFLFGPVEDDEYDPETDTWPVNFIDMDALLASSQPLGVSDIDALTSRALKGYHPIEYMLWGQGGTKTAADFTVRQKEYLVSLSAHLKIQAGNLYNSWIPAGGNYANKIITAGSGNLLYPTRQSVFIAITDGLVGICEEVGDGKMKDPFDAMDPSIVESPFSGNSISDFKNNIIGAYHVYLGKFNEDGTGLQDLVKARNSSLDVTLVQQFNTAINSFDAITVPFEEAIITQRTQCQQTMNAINTLANSIDTALRAFVITNITD